MAERTTDHSMSGLRFVSVPGRELHLLPFSPFKSVGLTITQDLAATFHR